MTSPEAPAQRAFRAMGSDAHVIVWTPDGHPVEPEDLLDAAAGEIERLEARWSRFRPSSDVSRLNAAGGAAVTVAPETLELLDLCLAASAWTGGRFDPMVLPALLDAGYDRSFDQLPPPVAEAERAALAVPGEPPVPGPPAHRAVPPAAIGVQLVLDRDAGTARLGPGTAIDLGGIGKGRAADLVASLLVDLGAVAACVNLGGDLRVVGEVPGGTGLLVGIEDPLGGADLDRWSVTDRGVATSSRLRRRWHHDGQDVHHLIDPATGRPSTTDVVACTVVARTGAWADVLAKVVLLAPPDEAAAMLADADAAAIVVLAGGRVRTLGDPPTVAGPVPQPAGRP